jgi:hypothetical protein
MPDLPAESSPKGSDTALGGTQRWFAGKEVDVLFFKINRRPPITGETLFPPPSNILTHLAEVLARPVEIETGRAHKRLWHIGNKIFNYEAGVLTGRVGWSRSTQVVASVWNEEEQAWEDAEVPGDVSAIAPFAFVADGRYLGILRHSSFSETALATVFRDALNRGESRRSSPSTDWDVEPVGDEQGFYEWVASTDRLLKVEFVFKRPNPDAEREFEDLFERMDALAARQIRESITAQDDERGLNKQALRNEPISRSFIAAAMAAFGYVIGRGIVSGRRATYDQRRQAAHQRLENVSASWQDATEEVLRAVGRARDRRQQGG